MEKTEGKQVTSHPYTRRAFLSTSLKVGAAAFTTGLLPKLHADAEGQYNVLFIIADDLRPWLGCYGHPEIHTPNIDRLAERGLLFNRAYCQLPLCNPSRASMLTGLRPSTTRIFSNSGDFREILPDAVDLQQYFDQNGYATHAVGKVVHERVTFTPSPSSQALDVDDDALSDGQTAKKAEEILTDIKDQQFFLAVGFDKPHLPFSAPRKYYELYNTQTFSLPNTSDYPLNAPTRSHNSLDLLTVYSDISADDLPLSEEKALEFIRGYAASTSYMDAQVGRVLNRLEAVGLTENTVIVFCGDHGFHLGEHGTWRKNTLFEVALRSPLIVSIPGQTYQGAETDALVELVDIYPTLCDTCQLPVPSQLEGFSLVPVIEEPTRPWKTAAFSQLTRAGVRGRSMRTAQYRYTEWGSRGNRGRELYDYDADPDETVNIVDLPENEELVANLSVQLRTGWQAALPDIQEQTHIPQTPPWDINSDGIVDIQDLLLVSNSFDTDDPTDPKADVNKDGSIDIIDLLLVAAHFGESSNPTAPPTITPLLPEQTAFLDASLTQARLADDGSDLFQKGIATLERLINTAMPTETVLLPNYPNPFNPETWIPYDLAEDAAVHIHIYTLKGESIRRLSLGFQTSGTYRSQTRAAYWDGRNAVGETVASGIYFYTLQAGKFKSTRQMVILK